MLRAALLITLAGLLTSTLQAQNNAEAPFPEASTYVTPKNLDLYFKQKVITVHGDYGSPVNFYFLDSADFTIETPPTEDWVINERDTSHSVVFEHRLLDTVSMSMDCYRTGSLPKITPALLQSKINQEALVLAKKGFNRFSVESEEDDFSATPPTRKLQMPDGSVVEVLKRGRTKPLRVAEPYLYDIIAQKVDGEGKVVEELMIHEYICVHPKGFTLICRVEGDVNTAGVVKNWLHDYLRNSQENANLLQAGTN